MVRQCKPLGLLSLIRWILLDSWYAAVTLTSFCEVSGRSDIGGGELSARATLIISFGDQSRSSQQ